jgi:hypothetical protein
MEAPQQVDLTVDPDDARTKALREMGEVLEDVKEALRDGKEGIYIKLCDATMKLSQAKSGVSQERVSALESQLDMAVYNCQRQRAKKRWACRDTNACITYMHTHHGPEKASKMIAHVKRSRLRVKKRLLAEVPQGMARDRLMTIIEDELADEEDHEDGIQNLEALARLFGGNEAEPEAESETSE